MRSRIRTGFRVNKLNICDAVIAVALIPVAYQSKDPNNMGLPHFAKGEVIKGFGRGSKELGCPTANFSKEVVDQLPADIETGVYCGFASVDQGNVYKMVMSIGWNPFYNNTTKSMETHILHKFDSDFYGKELRIVILEFLRPEKNFASLNELITAINSDIQKADTSLEDVRFSDYKNHSFFTS